MSLRKSPRNLGALALITGAVGICLLILPNPLFPQFYVSKANSAMGYVGPATVEGWVFMILGLCFVGITLVLRFMRR